MMNIQQTRRRESGWEERPEPRSMLRRSLVVAELYDESQQQEQQMKNAQRKETYKTGVEQTASNCNNNNNNNNNNKSFDALLHRLEPQPLPEFYVIGRTALTLESTRLPIILQRLCRCIKKCSMDFQVFPEEGRVDCRACLGPLSFSIWLFWKDHCDCHDQNNNHDLIVEMQRRQGCCVLMQRYRKAFTMFLQSGTDFDPNQLTRCPRAAAWMQRPQRQSLSFYSYNNSNEEETTLNQCYNMLESESDEERLLAMENIAGILSENVWVAPETVQEVAEAIVWGQAGKSCAGVSLLDELSFCIMGNQRRKLPSNETESCDFEKLEFEEGHTCGVLHKLALQIVVDALTVVVRTTSTTRRHEQPLTYNRRRSDRKRCVVLTSTPWRTIIHALCYNVSTAASRPQEAALSAQCLLLLDDLSRDHDVVHTVLLEQSLQIIPCLLEAQTFGMKHNERLGREVCNLLGRIQEII